MKTLRARLALPRGHYSKQAQVRNLGLEICVRSNIGSILEYMHALAGGGRLKARKDWSLARSLADCRKGTQA